MIKFDNFNIRIRLLVLIILILITYLLAYFLAIKETVALRNNYKQVISQVNQLEDAQGKIDFYENQILEMEKYLNKDSINDSSRNILLAYTEKVSDTSDVKLIDFGELLFERENDLLVFYDKITLKGSLNDMTRYYHKFESESKLNKIISLKFYLKRERFVNDLVLYSEGLIQTINRDEK